MEKFKKEIMKRRMTFTLISAVTACACIFDYLAGSGVIPMKPESDIVLAFQTGLLIGLFAVALVFTLRYTKAQKDPEKLRLLYNEEHDERLLLIRHKAGMPMLGITSGVVLFGGIVAGYFNRTVFYALVAAAAVQLLIGVAAKLYYTRALGGGGSDTEECAELPAQE